MSDRVRRYLAVAAGICAVVLGACQGNLGTGAGGGIGLPQAPAYGQQPAAGAPNAQSRQRVLEGAVTPGAGLEAIPLPSLDGFGISIALGTPTPKPSASASASAGPPTARPRGAPGRPGSSARVAAPAASASPAPSAAPSGAPASPAPEESPSVRSSDGGVQKIATKTTIYPDDAPAAPSPEPTGNVQTFAKRTALVRGLVVPVEDIVLYGLGALRFTVPAAEQVAQRGFTVALFEAGKKHHEKLVAFDGQASLNDSVVASALAGDPLTLKKNTGYLLMLYGDELPATPAPASGYASPGANPFVTAIPSGYPGGPGGPPAGPATAPPYGTGTPLPAGMPSRF